MSVSATFSSNGNVLHLNCTVINGVLQPEQELVWIEGGLEVKDRTGNMTVHQSNTSTLLTMHNVTPGLHYGEYGCQCYNRYNYTHNSLSKLIASGSYVQHCSSLRTTIAMPVTG